MLLAGIFDAYGRQARLQPALLLLFPLFLTVAVWFPGLYKWATGLVGVATACGVTVLLAHLARWFGRRAEKRLYLAWGGSPTTIWLRFGTDFLSADQKARYRKFFKGKVPSWKPPTEAEEMADVAATDGRHDAAVKWLIANTRDTKRYPLVFKELIAYGVPTKPLWHEAARHRPRRLLFGSRYGWSVE